MKYFICTLFVLTTCMAIFAQQVSQNDGIYIKQDSVLIPTRSGFEISAIIVRKKGNAMPLPAILFYTTYDQGPGDDILGKRLPTEIMSELSLTLVAFAQT